MGRERLMALAILKQRGSLHESLEREADAGTPFAAYRDRPVDFVREVLGYELWSKQAEILQALAEQPRVSVRSCHNAGKTFAAAQAALWFLQTRPGSIVITTAPSGRQVRDLLWREIRTGFARARQPLVGRCLTTRIDCRPDWYATGFSTDNPVNFQGPHSPAGVLVIGDEASGLPEWLYEAIDGLLTQEGARLLLIGNPNYPVGSFYESHRTWPAEQRFHISAFDVPPHILRPDWKEEMRGKYGEESPVYQVRVLGNFPPQGANALISLLWVEAAQNRESVPGTPIEIGVDVARFGDDESVAYVRAGSKIVDAAYWQGNDTMQSAGRVAALIQRWRPSRVKVDVIGLGAGVVDRLKEQGYPVIGVNVGQAAFDKEAFANLRAEIYDGLATRFRDGEIAVPPDDMDLSNQLTALTMGYTSRGQMQLVRKEDMKTQGFASPDRADALALCFAGKVDETNPLAGRVRTAGVRGWMPKS